MTNHPTRFIPRTGAPIKMPHTEMVPDYYSTTVFPKYYFGKTTVILPCRDRNDFLLHSLAAWLAQTYQPFEVVIVDYNSSQPVFPEAESIAKRYGFTAELNPPCDPERYAKYSKVSVIRVENVDTWNMAHALNIGVRRTTSDVISIAGCDTIPDPRYLETVMHIVDDTTSTVITQGRMTYPRYLWYRVNGYQEMCQGWGSEDCDFKYRVSKQVRVLEINPMLCPDLEHDDESRGGKHFVANGIMNLFKTQKYMLHHGHIANYAILPGGEEPILEKDFRGNTLWVGRSETPIPQDAMLTSRCCYAGRVGDNTVYYVVPASTSDELFAVPVVDVKTFHFDESVWRILDLMKDEGWRKEKGLPE